MRRRPYREISLAGRDGAVRGIVKVSAEDFERLDAFRWHLNGSGYAARSTPRPTRRLIYMHREIMGLPPGDKRQVDHINGDRLDNRRDNLRVVTPAENSLNRHHRGGSSRFRGVCWNRQRGMWRAQVAYLRENYCLGDFADEAEAGRVVVEFLVECDLEVARIAAERWWDALTPAERARQQNGARHRLVAAFGMPQHDVVAPPGSRRAQSQ